jgi:hypothetical protein
MAKAEATHPQGERAPQGATLEWGKRRSGMKCEQCGHVEPPSIVGPAIGACGNAMLMHFLNHVTPEPGFYSDWHSAFWWFTVVLCGFSVMMFLINCGIRFERAAHARS